MRLFLVVLLFRSQARENKISKVHKERQYKMATSIIFPFSLTGIFVLILSAGAVLPQGMLNNFRSRYTSACPWITFLCGHLAAMPAKAL